jgi:hypothetical protein
MVKDRQMRLIKGKKQAPRGNRATNWAKMVSMLHAIYSAAGMYRHKAVLHAYGDRHETVCRKLNVVCEADLSRIATKLGVGNTPG